jgi:ATP-dependent DNA helicase RecQ
MAKAKGMSMKDLLTEIETIVGSGTRIDINYFINEMIDTEAPKRRFLTISWPRKSDSAEEALVETGRKRLYPGGHQADEDQVHE